MIFTHNFDLTREERIAKNAEMGKIIGGILGTLAISGLVLFLLFHFGVLSFGKSDRNGDVKTETVTNM